MRKIFFALALVVSLLTACAGPARTVSRVAVDQTIDYSGNWNDTDSRLTSEQIISDVLSRPWLSDWTTEKGEKPTVIVGTIRNRSSEHLETGTFVKAIERELINSGKVRFVASNDERKEIRNERLDQQENATEESAKRLAAETGADFMLQGSIKSIVDAVEGKQVKFYQVDMELINVETNEKVWIGTKEIKKDIAQKKAKW